VGLIQREIESSGISTIGISIVRSFSEKIKPPRTVFLDWPFGHPLGKPFNVAQQRSVLMAAFNALYSIKTPGEIVDLRYSWKRAEYSPDIAAPEDQSIGKAGGGLVQIGDKKG
jgi:D-proline reductase (dithiol) PrdB